MARGFKKDGTKLTPPSFFGLKHTEETKKKMSLSQKGKIVSEESIKKMRESLMGKKASEETKKKMSEIHKGKIPWNKGKKGLWKHTEEWKKLMSERQKGNKHYNFGKKHSKETRKKMRQSQFEYIKRTCNIFFPRIGHNEKKILDKLEQEINYKIIRQFEVKGYFIDGYISELKIAIEVDERPKIRENDIERENIIKQELGCEFLRIKDYD